MTNRRTLLDYRAGSEKHGTPLMRDAHQVYEVPSRAFHPVTKRWVA